MLHSAAKAISATSIDCHLRRRAGIPKSAKRARIAPPPGPLSSLPRFGQTMAALVGAVVVKVTVAVPLETPEFRVTVCVLRQMGGFVEPTGDEVNAQPSVTVP